VSLKVVAAYGRALGGVTAVTCLLGCMVAAEALRVGATVWLSLWTGEEAV
jgi:hypothetical protein